MAPTISPDNSPPHPEGAVRTKQYNPDATLVLVGFVGAGKKTLGIIASVALRRRLIDFNTVFCQEVHASPQEYIAQHGAALYREVELKLTQRLLTQHQSGCVIVGLGWLATRQQQELLNSFAQRHPVVYIRRDRSELQRNINISKDKFVHLYEVGNPIFEACSNFDFFNLTQDLENWDGMPAAAHMRLKKAGSVFIAFLERIYGRDTSGVYSANPFTALHTHALQLPVSWLEKGKVDHEQLDSGADAVNILIDIDPKHGVPELAERLAKHIAILRMYARVPVFVEVAASQQTELVSSDKFLKHLLRLVPDVLVCSLSCPSELLRELADTKGSIRIIAAYHIPRPLSLYDRSADAFELLKRAENLGCDALRLTGESRDETDNLACISLRHGLAEKAKFPIIAYNTGNTGRSSLCLNPILSPVVLPCCRSEGISLQSAEQALAACFMTPKKLFTIFGRNVAQSLSPAMHNAAYTACGLPHQYSSVQSGVLREVNSLLSDGKHGGVAISLPFKTEVLPLLDEISHEARDIKAVNTVVLEQINSETGHRTTKLKGYNTDYIGIMAGIEKNLSPANAIRAGTSALIVGAGGMARAAVYACLQLGVRHICLYNRTASHAERLAESYRHWAASSDTPADLQIAVLCSTKEPWPQHLRQPTIIVACLPALEIDSQSPVQLLLPEQWLQSTTGGVFVDVAYGRYQTPLRASMNDRTTQGWIVVDGLVILLEQGIAQYELFTKRPAPVHVMRRAIQQQSRTSCPNSPSIS
ncbi:putative pentafunctional AROM polypeptide [Aspergillus saccharolyticus JOP 1030-1]|uniref:Pentafunctional AROM polypeptide n=1 Tax=Aspergillus saccharolyticus JOP 1030-1 TaxID=1450539 RepID=A0A318Z957_9EURO|nr:pentafunctional AROM polypeptide [Aspergillus saccharolyticus JOP 1030-1]PYH43729.1 pentafunctional AROM polypeptide [Aspergillus saccharolyticus JOP 1030-1]